MPRELAVSDTSLFDDAEWEALCEAPLLISMAMTAVGPHGPISLTKESMASAKAIATPADHGAANAIIAEIVAVAKSSEARHDVQRDLKEHDATTLPVLVDGIVADLEPAARALAKLPADEATGVKDWLRSIGPAIAAAAKGTSAEEQALIDRINTVFA